MKYDPNIDIIVLAVCISAIGIVSISKIYEYDQLQSKIMLLELENTFYKSKDTSIINMLRKDKLMRDLACNVK